MHVPDRLGGHFSVGLWWHGFTTSAALGWHNYLGFWFSRWWRSFLGASCSGRLGCRGAFGLFRTFHLCFSFWGTGSQRCFRASWKSSSDWFVNHNQANWNEQDDVEDDRTPPSINCGIWLQKRVAGPRTYEIDPILRCRRCWCRLRRRRGWLLLGSHSEDWN